MPFASDLARRAFFASRMRMLGQGLVGIVRGSSRVVKKVARRPADIIEGTRRTIPGAAIEHVIDAATGHEFASAIKKGVDTSHVVTKGLKKVTESGFHSFGRGSTKFQKKLLRNLGRSPILSSVAKGVGRGLNIGTKVTKRVTTTAIDLAQGDSRAIMARNVGSILTDEMGQLAPREIGRQIRRGKGFFTKNITKPAMESLTGRLAFAKKTVTSPKGPGIGSATQRKYGLFQRIRKGMSSENIKRSALDKTIKEAIDARRTARVGLVGTMKNAKIAVADQVKRGVIPASEAGTALDRARKVAKETHKVDLEKARNIYQKIHVKDKETGQMVTKTSGKLVDLFGHRYKGASDVNLGVAAAVGGTTLYVGSRYTKDFIDRLKRAKFMRERKKEDTAIRSHLQTTYRINHPELNEYELENMVESRIKQIRLSQLQASENVALRNLILSGTSAPKTPQSSQPKESGIWFKSNKRKLKVTKKKKK